MSPLGKCKICYEVITVYATIPTNPFDLVPGKNVLKSISHAGFRMFEQRGYKGYIIVIFLRIDLSLFTTIYFYHSGLHRWCRRKCLWRNSVNGRNIEPRIPSNNSWVY